MALPHATVISGSEQIAVRRLLAVSLPNQNPWRPLEQGGTNIPMDTQYETKSPLFENRRSRNRRAKPPSGFGVRASNEHPRHNHSY